MCFSFQIFVVHLVTGSFNIVTVEPLFQGFSIKKEFDVSLKPFVWKPISIIKEKWSPFGKFGVRHGIEKRELSKVEPAPVIEHDLYIEPATSIGPFLTTVAMIKLEDLTMSSEVTITPKPFLQPEFSNSPPPYITPSGTGPVTPFRPGTSFVMPSLLSFEPTPQSIVLINSAPIFRPESQNTVIPESSPQVLSSTSTINPAVLVTQTEVPPISLGQPFLPISASSVLTSRPIDYLFNTPVPLSILLSDSEIGNLLNSHPSLSGISQVQKPLPNFNTKQPGILPECNQPNIISTVAPIIPSAANNGVSNQGIIGETAQSIGLLNTDIGRADIVNDYLNTVNRQPILSKPEVKNVPPLPNNSMVSEASGDNQFGNNALIRGTKLALHFGNIFAQLMTQFFSNARLTLSQFPS